MKNDLVLIDKISQNKRISIDVTNSFLIDLKKRALERGITLKRYVLGVLVNEMKREDEQD